MAQMFTDVVCSPSEVGVSIYNYSHDAWNGVRRYTYTHRTRNILCMLYIHVL